LSLKQSVIPTPNYLEFRLVLTLEFASANSSASTHTNYLTVLLKNDPRFPGQTHNYTGGAPLLASPRLHSNLGFGVCRGTPYPQRAGHYSGPPRPVNSKLEVLLTF
jgi:hypothetical protein